MTLEETNHHTKLIADAIQRREDYYTMESDKGTHIEVRHIDLPTPQTCGTMTQQRSYATSKAQEILNHLSK